VPGQSGYKKRLRKCQVQLNALIRVLAHDTDTFEDDTWVIDSTPVECGLSTDRQTKRPGRFAGYGYCVRAPDSSSRHVSSSKHTAAHPARRGHPGAAAPARPHLCHLAEPPLRRVRCVPASPRTTGDPLELAVYQKKFKEAEK
jgi:hypothetical protein